MRKYPPTPRGPRSFPTPTHSMGTSTYGAISSPTLVEASSATLTKNLMRPSLLAQEHIASSHASRASPLFKQFIPVVVLAAFLLLFLASHLLRYPRILYIAHVGTSHSRDGPHDRQRRIYSPSKAGILRSGSFLRMSLSTSKHSKTPSPRDMGATYAEPTVRLVKGYSNRSPEPRVYLPEEITVPNSSPTLVGSSSSEFSVSNTEVHGLPPRVYLPPALPEDIGYNPGQVGDIFIVQDVNGAASSGMHLTSDAQPHATLSSSPTAPTFTGLYNLLNTSSDVHILPPSHASDFQAVGSSAMLISNAPVNDSSHVPLSPELSPPPLALAHPILVRRALSPWRRSPQDVSYNTIPQTATATTNSADSAHRHRPSVPSRLRYFITRSASVSLSSSHTHSTPESSLGKRSEKSSRASKPSPTGSRNHASFISEAEPHVEGDSRRASVIATLLRPSSWALTSPTHESTMIFNKQSQLANSAPVFSNNHPGNNRTSFLEPPTPPGASDASLESQAQFISDAEEAELGGDSIELRESSTFPSQEAHVPSGGYRTLLGLGLRVVSDSLPVHSASRPPSVLQSGPAGEMSWTEEQVEHGEDGAQNDSEHSTSPTLSLRTVLARWMTRMREDPRDMIEEEEGNRSLSAGNTVADESVEVMVMGRWTGLDGV